MMSFRMVDPGGEDGQLLLHAVGIGGDGLSQVIGQLEQVGVVPDAFLSVAGTDPEDIRDEVEILDAGHEVVQVGIVRNVRQLPLAGQGIFL